MGRTGRVLWLALFLAVGLPAAVPPAGAHPYHLQVENTSNSGSSDQVDDTTWLAQSFTAPTSFRVTQLAVYVRDASPSDVLGASVRSSVGGEPATTNLTQGFVDSGTSASWINISLSPWVDLTGGTVYWIVLRSLNSGGYDWYHSSNEAAYPGGIGMDSPDGAPSSWNARGHDFMFRVYGFPPSNLSFAASVSNGTPRPGDTTVFRTDITNSGPGAAAAVWVNVTLPPQLAYVSDDAPSGGPTNFVFTNVAPGLLSFNLTVSVDLGVPHGTIATTSFVFDSTDHNGMAQPRVTQTVPVVIQNSVLSFAASVSDGNPRPGDLPDFRADVTNSGGADAQLVWVNVTLPAHLTYVSDDAASAGGTRTGNYNFTFTNVAPGVLSFNLTVSVNAGIPDGTVATTTFVFDSTDYNGLSRPRVVRVVPVVIRNARLSLSLAATETLVDPGDLVTYNATARNVGQEAATNVALEGVLSPAVFFSASAGGVYDPGTRTVRRSGLTILASGQASLEWTVRVASGLADGAPIASTSQATYRDITGTAMTPVTANASITVRTPVFSVGLVADPAEAEKGDVVFVTLTYDNVGSATALGAWANWTIGSNYALVSLTPTFPYVTTSDGFDVHLSNVVQGPHAIVARLRVLRGLSDGTAMPIQVRWLATDGNGNPLTSPTLTAFVGLRAPTLTINASASSTRAEIDREFVMTVTLRNEGRATANGWLNLTLPPDVTFVTDNGTFLVTPSGTTVSWRIPTIAPGSRIDLAVTLRGRTSAIGTFRFTLDYTDGGGSVPASIVSNPVAVEFFGAGGSWTWWLLAVIPVPIFLVVFLLRRRVTIEEVFLVSHAGLLLAHMSYTIKHDKDRDVMSAMLTAIQEFVRDAFSASPERAIRSIDFGQRKILVRRGTTSYLAVVLKGNAPSSLPKRMDETLRKVETAFPGVADYVDGKMVESAGELLSRELLRR